MCKKSLEFIKYETNNYADLPLLPEMTVFDSTLVNWVVRLINLPLVSYTRKLGVGVCSNSLLIIFDDVPTIPALYAS